MIDFDPNGLAEPRAHSKGLKPWLIEHLNNGVGRAN